MRRKQNLKAWQDVPAPSAALSDAEALKQQVRTHPVVQEVMRLFDARIVTITRVGASAGKGNLAVEQQLLCFSSQEADSHILS